MLTIKGKTAAPGRPLLFDGGFGSLLIAAGLDQGQAPESWLLRRPEAVRQIHRAYVEAGCDLVTTNSFGASPPKLAAVGLAGRDAELNGLAVSLAREAGDATTLVAGDMGPTGLLFPPMGTATSAELEEAFSSQATHLAAAGADLLLIETIYDLREGLAAVNAARQTGLVVFATMTFRFTPRGFFTIMGDAPRPSLEALADAGATAVGFNCGLGSDKMLELVRSVASLDLPLLAQPNAGQPRPGPQGVVYDANPAQFARDLVMMVKEGVCLVGGCCGTDPAFLASARQALNLLARGKDEPPTGTSAPVDRSD